ncbi:hypothetical protein RJ639_006528 [Escallonia herrerae]|uniref:beta-galactosidase n=1 Tax=Escallonia herrerae TaxID=1293975 RepID=A0AA89AVB1_9ASTE|nr:hypothetical protein RJ639_006528 [Escallonia herrerae]
MKLLSSPQLIISHFFCLCFYLTLSFAANNVTYDRHSLVIDGQRKLLISTSIHYPRSVPTVTKEGGVDVIETYVFWNGHELSPGNIHARLYLILRIGPFVAVEWKVLICRMSNRGVPIWLHYVPGTIFRTDNEPFKNFTTLIVNMMKQEKLFASQGGPIILAEASEALHVELMVKGEKLMLCGLQKWLFYKILVYLG